MVRPVRSVRPEQGLAARSIVSTWHGVYVLDRGAVVGKRDVQNEAAALALRLRLRAEGRVTSEEAAALAQAEGDGWSTRDRRLVSAAVRFDPRAPGDVAPLDSRAAHREAVLQEAERAVVAAWDPSVHIEEAVRTLRDLDRALNLLGERLAGWAGHDAPGLDPYDATAAANLLSKETETNRFGPQEPDLRAARRQLGKLYLELRGNRDGLERAIASAAPQSTPNLAALLGSELASRLVAQAGGLERLARLPSSTVQVLGAEKAFFEHLRGRAPPPRHGLLFLHPTIQTAPRSDRGKLARALAAKASIAARLDHAGKPVDPSLGAAYTRRATTLAELRRRAPRRDRRGRSRPPFDRAAEHR